MSANIRKPYREITVIEDGKANIEHISLDKARNKLKEDLSKIDINGEAKTYLLTHPSGVGKTHHVAEYVKDRSFLWLCAIHDLARETIEKHFSGMNVVELKSRKYMIKTKELNCLLTFKIMNSVPEEASIVCETKCYMGCRCEYYTNLHKARKSNCIFGMHAHLQNPDSIKDYIAKSDIVIIDESFSSHYIGEEGFHKCDIENFIGLLELIAKSELMMKETRAISNELIKYLTNLLQDSESEISIDSFPTINDELTQIYYKAIRKLRWQGNIISMLQYAYKNQAMIVKRDDYYTYMKVAKLPDDVPIIILDASGNADFYEKMLNRKVIAYGLDQNVTQFAHVTQFLDGIHTRSSLLMEKPDGTLLRKKTYYRLVKLIQAIKHKHLGEKIVIGAKMSVEIKLKGSKIEDKNTKIIHYYDIRGINDYKDCDVLVILGSPMLSFDDIAREARLIFNQNWNDDEMVEQMKIDGKSWVKADYAKDGIGYEIHTFKFSNDYIEQYYRHSVIAELLQMLGRIRPYDDENEGKDKHVYIITNTPIPNVKIDEMITIKEFMQRQGDPEGERIEIRKINEAIKSLPNEFTVLDLVDKIKELFDEDRTREKQRRNLRDLLIRKQKVFSINIEKGKHTIRKVPANS
ncbi:TPA: hypothetical protein ENS27_04000 [bacterium]|nr:hypothetical protein [bacterium]